MDELILMEVETCSTINGTVIQTLEASFKVLWSSLTKGPIQLEIGNKTIYTKGDDNILWYLQVENFVKFILIHRWFSCVHILTKVLSGFSLNGCTQVNSGLLKDFYQTRLI